MKNYLIPLCSVAVAAPIWGFIVLSKSNNDRPWAVPLGVGFFLIGLTASMTATALRKIAVDLYQRDSKVTTNIEGIIKIDNSNK